MITNRLKKIDPRELPGNVFRLIADEWMLVTAGTMERFNTMTASWGAMGELWNKKIAICYVRPTRYTYGFMERSELFTLTFFDKQYYDALMICGTQSGRDTDKVKDAGLTPEPSPSGSVQFAEARLVLECRKIYADDLDPARFLAPEIEEEYPEHDYHRVYIGEILNCLIEG